MAEAVQTAKRRDGEIPKEKFRVVGKNIHKMDALSRPSLSYWQDAWRRIKENKVASTCLIVIAVYILLAIFVPVFSPYDMAQQDVSAMNQSPSAIRLKVWRLV